MRLEGITRNESKDCDPHCLTRRHGGGAGGKYGAENKYTMGCGTRK